MDLAIDVEGQNGLTGRYGNSCAISRRPGLPACTGQTIYPPIVSRPIMMP